MYKVPLLVSPFVDDINACVPQRWDPVWADRLKPEDYPWVRNLRWKIDNLDLLGAPLGIKPDVSEFEEGLAWTAAHRWLRPPQLGWPWWRIPLPGEEVPA